MYKNYIVLALIITVIACIISISLVISGLNNTQEQLLSSTNTLTNNNADTINNSTLYDTVKTNSSEIKISPNCVIIFYKKYSECGHTLKEKIVADDSIVNLSQEEFAKLYSDWKINKFTSNEIELSKNINSYCGQHYLVKADDGYVSIYNINSDNSVELKEKTDINVKYLSIEDMNELENGVTLFGKEALNSYIENFE